LNRVSSVAHDGSFLVSCPSRHARHPLGLILLDSCCSRVSDLLFDSLVRSSSADHPLINSLLWISTDCSFFSEVERPSTPSIRGAIDSCSPQIVNEPELTCRTSSLPSPLFLSRRWNGSLRPLCLSSARSRTRQPSRVHARGHRSGFCEEDGERRLGGEVAELGGVVTVKVRAHPIVSFPERACSC
jgi:hypothetical protein